MRRREKKKLGCCGYDELAYKPPTTSPIIPSGIKTKRMAKDPMAGLFKTIVPVQNMGNLPG